MTFLALFERRVDYASPLTDPQGTVVILLDVPQWAPPNGAADKFVPSSGSKQSHGVGLQMGCRGDTSNELQKHSSAYACSLNVIAPAENRKPLDDATRGGLLAVFPPMCFEF